ncbi:trypsin-like peptidase domain-containing protein [Gordonia sp. TBRC 11910]|uniref:Trypsin-like peptidase domain-containing protein n=1 Tax=Gordonia asplenii TaxID=2725283 RepID=A0A848KUI8_9ACTN|nr:hypothetical protein [Gordonia asplenii]NMO01889.1 trypsin-like peptidase domain-containing protein [Gordonia asplenii]
MKATHFASAVLATALVAVAPVAVAQAAPSTPVRSGMDIRIPQSIITDAKCTLGAVVSPTRAYTAAHCGATGKPVYNPDGARIGTITSNLGTSRHLDVAVITLVPGTSARVDAVDFSGHLVKGQSVSKYGVTTGLTRGTVLDPTPELLDAHGFSFAPPFLTLQETYSISTTLRSSEGDSGGGVRNSSGSVIGILSAGTGKMTTFAPLSRVPGYLR